MHSLHKLHLDRVLLRRARRAAAVGDVFLEQRSQLRDDLRIIGLEICLFANLLPEIEQLNSRQVLRRFLVVLVILEYPLCV